MTQLLQMEADAIAKAAEQIHPESVEQAMKLVTECKGKVILAGVGKSGIVAQKITATLNSIGIVSVYLHPCDALHGDIGIVAGSDIAILWSNSGETEELIGMIPHLKHRQVPIIAILGNLDSTIANQADVVLDATVDREACPLNLAPTTSTTVALAIGDALAMTCMQMRKITPEDFAFNHPAGRLGKRLTLKVRDIMYTGADSQSLLPQASWIEIVGAITRGGAGAVNIVNEQGLLLGLITDGDLRRWMQKTTLSELQNLRAQTIMTSDPVTVTADFLAYDALKLMENRPSQISVLSVVDTQGICLGLVRIHDLFKSGL